ncbi:hypothetical protein [Desulforamulus aquiferis]|uniref:Concentrative nucleoside transporter N-terminal domain-containing protein n=1 Tax=Desulforamulus aquiferis TaxID=1397668 RepID=A0AAW7Z8Z3_9FIRM|nr:hypothetical protein [Desulforamulus aquiferis]MDO7785816.1 hypothetical protein [Desulforamulus aquiferis]
MSWGSVFLVIGVGVLAFTVAKLANKTVTLALRWAFTVLLLVMVLRNIPEVRDIVVTVADDFWPVVKASIERNSHNFSALLQTLIKNS